MISTPRQIFTCAVYSGLIVHAPQLLNQKLTFAAFSTLLNRSAKHAFCLPNEPKFQIPSEQCVPKEGSDGPNPGWVKRASVWSPARRADPPERRGRRSLPPAAARKVWLQSEFRVYGAKFRGVQSPSRRCQAAQSRFPSCFRCGGPGEMSVAGIKKQFYKASQVGARLSEL